MPLQIKWKKKTNGVGRVVEQRAITEIPGYWPDASDVGIQPVASVSRALSLVPVFGAVRLLADSIASLPLVVFKNDSHGIPRRQPTPSLLANPSIHGTLYDWIFRLVTSMALQGDGIGLVTARNFYGFPTMIEWLNPEQVATNDGKLYGPGSYMNPMWWWWGRPIDPSELLHIPWFTIPYRVRGVSPIGAYQMTTNIGIGAQEYSMNWFGQGGVPPGTFRNSQMTIDPKDADLITARLTARLQSRKPLVYGADWTYTPIAIKPAEAEFVSTMQLTATQIATIYGVPAEKIGGTVGDGLTYATVTENNIAFLTHSLRPWLRRIEYALTRCFPNPYFVKFDVSDLLRVDPETKAQIDALSLGFQQQGWRSQDEVRASYDLPPLPKPVAPPAAPADTHSGETSDSTVSHVPVTEHGKSSNANAGLSGARGRKLTGRQAFIDTLGRVEYDYIRERMCASASRHG